MDIQLLMKSSYKNLASNKIRAFLTMLGVIIGVFSVVVLIAIGNGIESFITTQFNSIGSNLLFVAPGVADFGDDPAKAFSRNKLDDKHLDLLEAHAGSVIQYFTPSIRLGETLKYKTTEFTGTVIGGNYQAIEIFNYEIDKGTFFTKQDEREKAKVIVLGNNVRKELFGASNAIGESISIGDEKYIVIGTFKPLGPNLDDNAVAPYTSIRETFDVKNFSSIGITLKSQDNVDRDIRTIELALLRDLKEDDFTVLSQADILGSIQSILGMLTLGIGAIAGISLLVGGIGIMNIMLVSVTERTKEIGLRKALGATSFNIGIQFMLESTAISLLGGVLGLLFGWLATLAAKSFFDATITLWSAVLAIGFSLIVGVGFGTYPAFKASKKNPIESLRYE